MVGPRLTRSAAEDTTRPVPRFNGARPTFPAQQHPVGFDHLNPANILHVHRAQQSCVASRRSGAINGHSLAVYGDPTFALFVASVLVWRGGLVFGGEPPFRPLGSVYLSGAMLLVAVAVHFSRRRVHGVAYSLLALSMVRCERHSMRVASWERPAKRCALRVVRYAANHAR